MYIRTTLKSAMLARATDVHVFLPFHDGYPDVEGPFPTLYFLPGYSANAEELATCLPFRRMSSQYGIAVVIPDGENSFYTDHPERATLNGSFVAQELVDVTRRLFPRLSQRREDTYIGGISMGGYGAAVHGLNNHETFSKIVMMSPAIEADTLLNGAGEGLAGAVPGVLFQTVLGGAQAYGESCRNPRYSIEKLKAEGGEIPRMHLCCGKQDALVYGACQSFRGFLERQGVCLSYEEGDGLHDVPYWDEHLEACFRFLKGK